MSLAERIAPTLAARAARAAALQAQRDRRDAFVLAQFALLQQQLDALLVAALGQHVLLTLTRSAQMLAVSGHSFAALAIGQWQVQARFNGAPQTVVFTPGLDFSGPDQFGRVRVVADFDAQPPRGRAGRVAQCLLDQGVVMAGASTGQLLLPMADGPVVLDADLLEAAFAAWWLR